MIQENRENCYQGFSGDGDVDEEDSFSDEEDGEDDDDDDEGDDDEDEDEEEDGRLGNTPEDEDDHGVDGKKFKSCKKLRSSCSL